MVCRFKQLKIIPVTLAVGIILFSGPLFAADIYMCRNAAGKVSFTNLPADKKNCTPAGKSSIIRLPSSAFKTKSSKSSYSAGNAAVFDVYIRQASRKYRLDPNLIRAVIHTESNFNPWAVSSKGAQGLMQLMPATAALLGVSDPFDPQQNIMGGTRYLRAQLDTFKGDLLLSLAAYNAGPNLVKKLGRVPHIDETKNYLKKVIHYYKIYRKRYRG